MSRVWASAEARNEISKLGVWLGGMPLRDTFPTLIVAWNKKAFFSEDCYEWVVVGGS